MDRKPTDVQFGRRAHVSIRLSRCEGRSFPVLTIRNASLEFEITCWTNHPQLDGRTTGYSTVYTEVAMPDHTLVMAHLRDGDAFNMAEKLLMPLTGGYRSTAKAAERI